MPTDTHDRGAPRHDAEPLSSPRGRDEAARCSRCDRHAGRGYIAEVSLPPGRARERATAMRDALIGSLGPWLCPGCAGILAVYGHSLGWRLRTTGLASAPPTGPQPRTLGRAARRWTCCRAHDRQRHRDA